jgi:capsular exopolysaccharide synthesis family protein
MRGIQNILEKAERDGSVRRIRGDDRPPAPVHAGIDAPSQTAPAAVEIATVAAAVRAGADAAVKAGVPVRVVSGARLDRRLLAAMAADSIAAEQYRALRTRIFHADNGAAVHVVLITSPGRGEGKTLTAGNLGLTMAQDYQRRTCVVDADLRHPQLQRLFGLPDGPGLSDVLTGEATLEEALVTVEDHRITILPAGRTCARPAELLGTTAMRRTLETLRSQFDRVVVDAPATTPLADVGILTPLVDSVLLVVRSGTTSKPAIHDAVAALDASKLLGVVLNEAA